jgi:alpha-mannosidase
LLTITDPNVLLWSLKPAEDGHAKGLVARVWNMNYKATYSQLRFKKPVKAAWRTSHIETDEANIKPFKGTLPLVLRAHQIATYRVVLNK